MAHVQLRDLKSWAKSNQVFLDVRSSGEFQQGHLPGAVNLPILDDQERAQVGLTYKEEGRDVAVHLGHKIVSGENRERKLRAWCELARKNPELIVTCFRGGLRSQTARLWLQESGYERPLIEGGYKACRQLLLEKLEDHSQKNFLLLVSGPTGAAKTHFLRKAATFWPSLDLEAYAHHRGSAFGKLDEPQPQQAVFENRLVWDLLKVEDQSETLDLPLLVEDESRMIGRCVQPESFFKTLRESEILWLDVDLEARVENTFLDYIQSPLGGDVPDERGLAIFHRYQIALRDIRNRLGLVRYDELSKLLQESQERWLRSRDLSFNKLWIRRLLTDYYDPLYFGSLERRAPKVYFRGSPDEAFEALKGAKSRTRAAPVRRKASSTLDVKGS